VIAQLLKLRCDILHTGLTVPVRGRAMCRTCWLPYETALLDDDPTKRRLTQPVRKPRRKRLDTQVAT
jgi:hypothetical protein